MPCTPTLTLRTTFGSRSAHALGLEAFFLSPRRSRRVPSPRSSGVSGADGQRLVDEHVPMTETDFWSKFWGAGCRDQVWEALDPEFVRLVIRNHPENIKALMGAATAHMEALEQTHRNKSMEAEEAQQFLGCVRILTRCALVAVESAAAQGFAKQFLWSKPPPLPSGPRPGAEAGAEARAADAKGGAEASASLGGGKKQVVLARRVIKVLCRALFVPGLTVAPLPPAELVVGADDEVSEAKRAADAADEWGVFPSKLWSRGGVERRRDGAQASDMAPAYNADTDLSRVTVLRALTVCLSSPLFVEPQALPSLSNKWAKLVVGKRNSLASTTFFSLLNVIASYQVPSASLYSYLTYSGGSSPERCQLIDASLQFLLILLDYKSIHRRVAREQQRRRQVEAGVTMADAKASSGVAGGDVDKKAATASIRSNNAFVKLLAGITETWQIRTLFGALSRLLRGSQPSTSYFAGEPMRCYQEVFVLLWHLLEENPAFLRVAVNDCDILELVRPLLYFMYDCRNDSSKLGLLYTCIFILLRISSDRGFCVALNAPYPPESGEAVPLPGFPAFTGTHADLLVLVCQKVVISSPQHLDAMLNGMLTVIGNMSPYLTRVSVMTSVKLVNLFEIVSAPRFLYSNPVHHTYVFLLLDIFNNLIQYQYAGCPHLVYAIARRAKLFHALKRLLQDNPPEGVKEARRRKLKKAQGGAAGAADVKSPAGGAAADGFAVNTPGAAAAPAPNGGADASAGPAASDEMKGVGGAKKEGRSGGGRLRERLLTAKNGTAKAKFKAIRSWVKSWHRKLPLDTILRLLDFFLPIFKKKAAAGQLTSTEDLLVVIRRTTLVGVLPAPHPIVVNQYLPNATTTAWFSTFLWGVVYLRNPTLFTREHIRLFPVYEVSGGAPSPPEGDEAKEGKAVDGKTERGEAIVGKANGGTGGG